MKKYLAVLSLQVRGTVYKITAVLLALAAVELLFFAAYRKDATKEYEDLLASWQSTGEWETMPEAEREQTLTNREITSYNLDDAVQESHAAVIFRIAFAGVAAVLAWTSVRDRSKGTVNRLSVGVRKVYCIWAVYHVLCIALLFAWQLLVVLLMDRILCAHSAAWAGLPQRLFLTFYRNDFLHSLLPLAETVRWVSNGLFVLAAGIGAAFVGYETLERRFSDGKLRVMLPVVIFAWNLASFVRGIHVPQLDAFTIAGSLVSVLWCAAYLFRREEVSG